MLSKTFDATESIKMPMILWSRLKDTLKMLLSKLKIDSISHDKLSKKVTFKEPIMNKLSSQYSENGDPLQQFLPKVENMSNTLSYCHGDNLKANKDKCVELYIEKTFTLIK